MLCALVVCFEIYITIHFNVPDKLIVLLEIIEIMLYICRILVARIENSRRNFFYVEIFLVEECTDKIYPFKSKIIICICFLHIDSKGQ